MAVRGEISWPPMGRNQWPLTLIKERGIHLGRCKITKTLRTQHVFDVVAFIVRDPPRNRGVLLGRFRS
ncbi:MAG: hypothetical protein M5U23_04525 [Acidimicrobiia bacterium]|nr:hypothetical protein [Acidimicrobiia bacterium]